MTKRTKPPYAGDERTMLLAFLDWHRDTLRVKTEGLDAAQLGTRLEPSTLTLGGLLKHMAWVEDWWFGINLLGRDAAPPFDGVDWRADRDWELTSAKGAGPEELRELFDRFTAASDEILAGSEGLDQMTARKHPRTGEGLSLRWILLHMIEEYARHNGHADLIRESIDGSTGQ
jgi:uncharacterized damage-inducible protein DinB